MTLIEDLLIGIKLYNKLDDNSINKFIYIIKRIIYINPLILVPGANMVKNILNIFSIDNIYKELIYSDLPSKKENEYDNSNEIIIEEIDTSKKRIREIWNNLSLEEKREILYDILHEEEILKEDIVKVLKKVK